MGRPREFIEADVIARARDAFWSGGVDGTSVSELCAATGLSAGSIYKAFGSKQGLFHRTLESYLAEGRDAVQAILVGAARPVDGLRDWLDVCAEQIGTPGPTSGCYAVVTSTEKGGSDAGARRLLLDHDAELVAMLRDHIAAAVADGDLETDPATAARMLLATVNGLQVEARKGFSADEARAALHLALTALTP